MITIEIADGVVSAYGKIFCIASGKYNDDDTAYVVARELYRRRDDSYKLHHSMNNPREYGATKQQVTVFLLNLVKHRAVFNRKMAASK